MDRELTRSDLGNEVGSENYVSSSSYSFIKTKALQQESYLLDKSSDAFQYITPQSFVDMKLKEGDVIISKDSNVGEIVILEKTIQIPCYVVDYIVYQSANINIIF